MSTNYKTCPFCGAKRMLYQVIDGENTRTCFKCFRVQRQIKIEKKEG
jgi:hypothetical protein